MIKSNGTETIIGFCAVVFQWAVLGTFVVGLGQLSSPRGNPKGASPLWSFKGEGVIRGRGKSKSLSLLSPFWVLFRRGKSTPGFGGGAPTGKHPRSGWRAVRPFGYFSGEGKVKNPSPGPGRPRPVPARPARGESEPIGQMRPPSRREPGCPTRRRTDHPRSLFFGSGANTLGW